MSFYQISRREIFRVISSSFPDAEALRYEGVVMKEDLPSHLLWMIKEMEEWDKFSFKKAIQAGPWIGWMFRAMEELGFFTLDDSREFFRKDVDERYDIPH